MTRKLLFAISFLMTGLTFAQTANQPNDLMVCDDDMDDIVLFNLTLTEPEVLGTQNPVDFLISYHTTQQDADNDISAIPDPTTYANVSNPQTIYVRLELLANGDFDTTSFALIVSPLPIVEGPFEFFLCDDLASGSLTDGLSLFDLTSRNDEISGGDATINVTWYETFSDEMANNPIVNPEAYLPSQSPMTVVARATSIEGCSVTTTMTLAVVPNPSPSMPTPLIVCDNDDDGDGIAAFDLHLKDFEIGNGETNITIRYYETLFEAEIGNVGSELVSPYINTVSFLQIIYARVTHETPPNVLPCFTIVELALIVELRPFLTIPTPLIGCEDDGDGFYTEFVLSSKDSEITNDNPDISISYHPTLVDAENETLPLTDPYANTTPFSETIYARGEEIETGCFSIVELELLVFTDCPIIDEEPEDLGGIDENGDGFAIFDLTLNESSMLGEQDPLTFVFSYHHSLEDASNGENTIATPTAYENVTDPEEIFVRLTNSDNGAYTVTSFQIYVVVLGGFSDNNLKDLVMHPNPTTNEIRISGVHTSEVNKIEIYSVSGALVESYAINGSSTIALDVSALNQGLYFVKISSDDQVVVRQLVRG